MGRPLEDLSEKFWRKVNKKSGKECWEWTASKFRRGYGQLSHGQKNLKAHRVSYVLHFGNIPDGKLVCHRCDNPSCVNPEHLFLGSQFDNVKDQIAKGRRHDVRGEKNGMAKLTEKEVNKIRKEYKLGKVSQYFLAAKFGVSQGHISEIINNVKRAIT